MDILWATLLLLGLGLLCGLLLSLASRLWGVKKNELEEALREALPGVNCGVCGYAGCDAYAAALAKREAPVGRCTPGGQETLDKTAALLGVTGALVEQVAVVRCGGCDEKAAKKLDFVGTPSCKAAMLLFGGDKGCAYGCLGYGDCVAGCDYHAIALENGVAKVNPTLCRGCGLCAATCPKDIIVLAKPQKAAVLCHSPQAAKAQRAVCTAGCIACGKCQKVCPTAAIAVQNNLAVVNDELCDGCGACVAACPAKCITLL